MIVGVGLILAVLNTYFSDVGHFYSIFTLFAVNLALFDISTTLELISTILQLFNLMFPT